MFVDLVTAVAIGLIAAGITHAQQLETLELDSVISVPLLDQMFFSEYEEMAPDRPVFGAGRPGGAQGEFHRCILQEAGRSDRRGYQRP